MGNLEINVTKRGKTVVIVKNANNEYMIYDRFLATNTFSVTQEQLQELYDMMVLNKLVIIND